MADLFISGINQKILDKFTNRLNKLRAGGAKKGDKSKYAIEAITQWLDSTTPKDRGHILLQKKIDELKAENIRLLNENVSLITETSAQKNMLKCLETGAIHIKPESSPEKPAFKPIPTYSKMKEVDEIKKE